MKKLTIQPLGESALVTTGTPLLSALLAKDLRVLMSCGGKGICSTCHVKVRSGMDQLSPVGSKERRTLSLVADSCSESRLACQTHVYGDGVTVHVPEGMYIERAEDLLSLLGSRAPENILHPITGVVLIPKGKIITRTMLEQSRHLEQEVNKLKNSDSTHSRPAFTASGISKSSLTSTTIFATQGTRVAKAKPEPTPFPMKPRVSEPAKTDPVIVMPAMSAEDHRTRVTSAIPVASSTAPRASSILFASTEPKDTPAVDGVRAGASIDKYLLLEQVGKGGAGVVYRALHTKLKTLVAVKFLRPDSNGQGLDCLAKEAQLLAQLSHPNVVRVIDFEDNPARPYVVMEFVDGLTAADLIKQSGRVSPGRALEIALDVVAGLDAAWKLGIVHRDIKPGNILVTRTGRSKLVDLGLATVSKGEAPREPGTMPIEGTIGYMAPEAVLGNVVDHRSDMYSLGATLFHLLAGRLPYVGRSSNEVVIQHLHKPVPDILELVHEVPPEMAELIQRLLAKSPGDRFDTYDELRETLQGLQAVARGELCVSRNV